MCFRLRLVLEGLAMIVGDPKLCRLFYSFEDLQSNPSVYLFLLTLLSNTFYYKLHFTLTQQSIFFPPFCDISSFKLQESRLNYVFSSLQRFRVEFSMSMLNYGLPNKVRTGKFNGGGKKAKV